MLTVLLSGVSVQLDPPRPIPPGRRGQGSAWRKWAPLAAFAALLLAGCAPSPPDFVEVLRQDCERGSAEACSLYSSFDRTFVRSSGIAPPVHSREIVEAILAGMRRARSDEEPTYPKQLAPLVRQPANTQ